jgi:transcriptional regulator with XRE-family HTH domain
MMPPRDQNTVKAIGVRLRKARNVLGLSQKELYDSLKVGASTWHNWETGKRLPDPIVMVELRRAYGVSVDWIYAGETRVMSRSLIKKLEAAD